MSDSFRLNNENLGLLPESILRPTYDRSKIRPGIVHVGVGGFHRAHQAFYVDQLLSKGGSKDWGICGIGLLESDRKMEKILREQDYLYTLIVKHLDGQKEHRVIGSVVDFILGYDHPVLAIFRMSSQDTKIVSLTITEGGYNFNPTTGEFNLEHPDVQHDLSNWDKPKTIFGFLAEALRTRKRAGLQAFTIQSCDNIQHNGEVAKKMLLAFAHAQDPEIAAWIEQEVSFPNAMVDRITPVTAQEDIDGLESELGLIDEWPVSCEPFCQWVIEDNFSNGRPAWEEVGAQFVPDVTPYESMKIRLLNAGHSVLGLLGSIHGHETIDSCIVDPRFRNYVRRFMDDEVTPVLDPVEGIDLDEYKDSLIERFGNTNIKDDLSRICLESSAKIPKFLLPTILENLKSGGSIKLSALVLAAWCFYSARQTDKNGKELLIVDEMKDELHEAAKRSSSEPLSFLRLEQVFGDLAQDKVFTDEYLRLLDKLDQDPEITAHMAAVLE